jgi:ribosomal protein S18 acetylase RimI-like enzyme
MGLVIRLANLSDLETIAAYNTALADETEGLKLDSERLRQGIRVVLADSSKGFYTVAERDGRIIGQMMITFEWSDWRNGVFWWIQSVYVHPAFRRQGIFRRLYDHVLNQAKSAGPVCGLRLYVEKENRRAQQTYTDLGMQKTSYEVYEVDFVIERRSGSLLPLGH